MSKDKPKKKVKPSKVVLGSSKLKPTEFATNEVLTEKELQEERLKAGLIARAEFFWPTKRN